MRNIQIKALAFAFGLVVLAVAAPRADAADPYVVRGNEHIIIGITLDEAAVRAALPAGLEPFLVVSYLRKRFVLERTGTRIALDWDICVPRVHPRFGPVPDRPLNTAVVELKGDLWVLPPDLQELSALGVRLSSFSKYGQCAERVLGVVSSW